MHGSYGTCTGRHTPNSATTLLQQLVCCSACGPCMHISVVQARVGYTPLGESSQRLCMTHYIELSGANAGTAWLQPDSLHLPSPTSCCRQSYALRYDVCRHAHIVTVRLIKLMRHADAVSEKDRLYTQLRWLRREVQRMHDQQQ
jgi:hypothetical protein